ncbi:MAG: AAC(3) family N-acetyltransferase [Thermoleophilaceae bacterium]
MPLTLEDVTRGISRVGLGSRPVCLHSSLSSFGHVDGGPTTIVDAFLADGRTLLVPTFSWEAYAVTQPPPRLRPARNGTRYDQLPAKRQLAVFSPTHDDVDRAIGAIPAEVLARPGRQRGNHPLCSFSAIGPESARLTKPQTPTDVYAPLDVLARRDGFVVLAGVGLDSMTLLHRAEEVAGRTLFRRWARVASGDIAMVAVGGCSQGFGRFDDVLRTIETRVKVGRSTWRVLPAQVALEIAAAAIKRNPAITSCGAPGCERCADAVLGGPSL